MKPSDVSQLLKQFKEMQRMMKRMGGLGTKRMKKKGRKGKKAKGGRVTPKGKSGAGRRGLELPGLDDGSAFGDFPTLPGVD